jgi:hypothetical protein
MRRRIPTEEEAERVITQFPDKDDYINSHFQMRTDSEGEASDDSIECGQYWDYCKYFVEHGPDID